MKKWAGALAIAVVTGLVFLGCDGTGDDDEDVYISAWSGATIPAACALANVINLSADGETRIYLRNPSEWQAFLDNYRILGPIQGDPGVGYYTVSTTQASNPEIIDGTCTVAAPPATPPGPTPGFEGGYVSAWSGAPVRDVCAESHFIYTSSDGKGRLYFGNSLEQQAFMDKYVVQGPIQGQPGIGYYVVATGQASEAPKNNGDCNK